LPTADDDDDDDDNTNSATTNAAEIGDAPLPPLSLGDDARSLSLSFKPFEIRTIRLLLKQ
jgi:hypothetical protein